MAANNAFIHFIDLLSKEVEPDEVEAWVFKLKLLDYSNEKVVLGNLNQFFCNFIQLHHGDLIRKLLLIAFGKIGLREDFTLDIQKADQVETNAKPKSSDLDSHSSTGLNPHFTFNQFINGGNSDMAYAAAIAVGEDIKENKYNPLFMSGDVGLGKTHLLQAIGLRAKEKNPDLKILYATSKDFINEVIEGIRFQKIQQVRNKYSLVDLLMIDDIQFLENKESTQEEFFQIFNDLIQNNKQIILTSDRYPREIQNLEERLVNRFNSGMVTRIYPPDFETRVAIIQTKTEQKQIELSSDIIDYIAGAIKSNVRDIEGILIHIEANLSLLGAEITIDAVKRIIKEVLNLEGTPRTIENIIKLVGQKFNIKVADLKSDKRTQEISKPRQIAMYVSREATGLSFPAIADHFGGKNHTTVIQAHKKTKEWIEKDPEIKQTITSILRELG